MFVGRTEELAVLEQLYHRDVFQMAVVYGRRRVGKTRLLEEFSRNKPTLFFTARIQSSVANLRDFSRAVASFFELPNSMPPFGSWADALSFVASQMAKSSVPLLFVFDEFPYAAQTEPSLPSTLQVTIDHEFLGTHGCMVLCGSNEDFMESEVLGRKSPLYGRRNAQIRLQPFDCLDAAKMLGDLPPEELVRYYATFGGTPYYLAQIDLDAPYETNVERLMFSMYGLLYEEPMMLLRQELREPALYNSVLSAVGAGATKPKAIAERAGVEQSSVAKYLQVLSDLGLIRRSVPLGENPAASRRGIYRIDDPFFSYWYRFVAPCVGSIEEGAGTAAARQSAFGEALSTYVGAQFETVCRQWLVRRNRDGTLPFLASSFGKWWGTDPEAREEVDIDVVAANGATRSALFGECKWRGSFDESEAIRTLEKRSHLVQGYDHAWYVLFSKKPLHDATLAKLAERDRWMAVDAQGLFDIV